MLQFGSKIQFVPARTFDQLPRADMTFVDERDGANLLTAERGFTQDVLMCNAGGITNGKRTVFFHFRPWGSPNNTYYLNKAVQELKRDKLPLRGLLVGGHSSDAKSVRLKRLIRALFEREHIPFSTFWGHRHSLDNTKPYPQNANRRSWHSDLAFDTKADTWQIRTYFQDAEAASVHEEDALSPEELQRAFQEIHIDDGDTVEINGQSYPADQLKQRQAD